MAALALPNTPLLPDVDGLPVVVIGRSLMIDYANDSAHEALGHKEGALVGQAGSLLWPVSRRGELGHVQAVLSGQRARRVRTTAQRRDGGLVDVEMRFEPWLDAQRRIRGVVVRIQRLRLSRTIPPPLPPRTRTSIPPVDTVALASKAPLRVSPPPQAARGPSLGARSTARSRHAPSGTGSAREHFRAQLDTAVQLMRWLDTELSEAPSSRDRARMRIVLADAHEVVADCLRRLPR